MSTKHMLIDAAYPEETRVAIVDGNRLSDYDVEVANRRQLKGNIYLAKLTRVEPSLQAAFVDYGGNRHGFLAFNEIHPDYYQIPVADREALLAEQKAAEAAADADRHGDPGDDSASTAVDEDDPETRRPRNTARHHYKIQEVIKRRQIMLVQVAKEERGSKGAALTTYLSLAGRYCVLMPNTTRGGGISRKITSIADRKRLKQIVADLAVPDYMAVILRTAGSDRSKAEIRRDYEYLMRLWNNIRELTMSSMAPALVYEEGNLIKRSIRDLYDRAIEDIIIDGEGAYRTCKDFMKLFTPSHAKRVKLFENGSVPLFQKFGVENELEAMHKPMVHLTSGGSIVINPTEALVSIDVNSGRATRERHIEETALRTNLEACEEISRQLRLRDLAGLIVIDFIDMENQRYQGQVERRLKEAMKADRARVQFGRISPFGLLELSRQRLRPSLAETSFSPCGHCGGTGLLRSTESMALAVLRRIEQECIGGDAAQVTVTIRPAVALYLLNQKRRTLVEMETRYDVEIAIDSNEHAAEPLFAIEPRLRDVDEAEPAAARHEDDGDAADAERDDSGRRGRRRRKSRRRSDADVADESPDAGEDDAQADIDEATEEEEAVDEVAARSRDDDQEAERKRRRRGKRGGRRRSRRGEGEAEDGRDTPDGALVPAIAAQEDAAAQDARAQDGPGSGGRASSRRRRRRQPGRGSGRGVEMGIRFDAAGFIAYDEPDPHTIDVAVVLAMAVEPAREETPLPLDTEEADDRAFDPHEGFIAADEPDPEAVAPPVALEAAATEQAWERPEIAPEPATPKGTAEAPRSGRRSRGPRRRRNDGDVAAPAAPTNGAEDGGTLRPADVVAPDEPDPAILMAEIRVAVPAAAAENPRADSVPIEGQPNANVAVPDEEPDDEPARQLAEEARRTVTVNVDPDSKPSEPRRGWWQRLLS